MEHRDAASGQHSPVIGPADVLPVQFYVLLGDEPVRASVKPDDNLVDLFAGLREDPVTSRCIPPQITYLDCAFYQLKDPVLFALREPRDGDGSLRQAKQACKEAGNRSRVEPVTTPVRLLAEQFFPDHAYLAIELPDWFSALIDATHLELGDDRAVFLKCLQVTVERLAAWTPTDVQKNLNGGIFIMDITALPPVFRETRDALAQPRWYKPSDAKDDLDFQIAQRHQKQFERVFAADETNSRASVCSREVAAFNNLRWFNEDVLRIADHNTSWSLKTSNLAIYFLQPPFFSLLSCNFEYQQNKSWSFPIFVDAIDPPNAFRKLIPKSDCLVFAYRHDIPFVICQVGSDRWDDHSQMIVQATAIARAGQFLLRPGSKKTFSVVALYLNASMVVSRYIIMQTEGGDAENDRKPVSIHEQCFDLRDVHEQVGFLREMYNLAAHATVLSRELDPHKTEYLYAIHKAARELRVMSLSTKGETRTMGESTMHSTSEESASTGGVWNDEDRGVFGANDIQDILRQMQCVIEFILHGHPHLAMIGSKTGDTHGYLKFVEREEEVNILRYLTGIQSLSNHTIPDIQFWLVEGGTLISMPVAGGWLTSLENRNEQLWSVALQLVEAVAFMHEHNVAHMDLKPSNVIIPPEGGRLSIIDFSVSIRVRSPDTMYSGVVGTEEYIAPEVRQGPYKPMLADLWSCGRTLEELCAGCRPSADHATLVQMSRRLMGRHPEARPKMSTLLEEMALAK